VFGPFSTASVFKLWYNGKQIAQLSLAGTTQAAQETARCEQAFTAPPAAKADPFKPTGPATPVAKADPFKV
jgi:hypothetical protein